MRRDPGFTLIEVMVALSVGAIVVLLAHGLFVGVADGARRLADARAALDREANARRWLVDAFGSLAVGDGSGAFEGRGDRVEFGSWQQSERGWLRRERIGLARRSQQFVASLGSERELVLADGISALEFDYLLDPGDASTTVDSAVGALGERARFVREWISPVSAPVAVRVRVGHAIGTVDTLLLIVGPRG